MCIVFIGWGDVMFRLYKGGVFAVFVFLGILVCDWNGC